MSFLTKYTNLKPKTAVILGSGISLAKLKLQQPVTIPFTKIPGLLNTKIPGHEGKWRIGSFANKDILLQRGRLHYYELVTAQELLHNITLLKKIGVKTIILTTACGCVNRALKPGQIMTVTDQINLMGFNPIKELQDLKLITKFPSMANIYDQKLQTLARKAAKKINLKLVRGILAGVPGPSYETPAESRMLFKLGCDAVTMSVIPAAIYAHYLGMKVMGLACIANEAGQHVSHQQVLKTMKKVDNKLVNLIENILLHL